MEEKRFENLAYLVKYPRGYESGKRYPVILFLHGAGTRGEDINILKNNMFMGIPEKHEHFPFVIVAPHCKGEHETWFDYFETLKRFTAHILSESYTDATRLYLMGNSMGGYGTWALGMAMPEVFAAAVPICGGGMYWNAAQLKNVPVWAFHGTLDDVVNVDESIKMVNAVNKAGGNAKLTVYTECYHDSWTNAFHDPELFRWLLKNENKNEAALTNEFKGADVFG